MLLQGLHPLGEQDPVSVGATLKHRPTVWTGWAYRQWGTAHWASLHPQSVPGQDAEAKVGESAQGCCCGARTPSHCQDLITGKHDPALVRPSDTGDRAGDIGEGKLQPHPPGRPRCISQLWL